MNKEIIKESVREVLEEFGIAKSGSDRKYYPASDAWVALGYENRDRLYHAVKSGLFRIGIEVQDRRLPSSKISRYYFDIEKCEKRLSEKPERRGNRK